MTGFVSFVSSGPGDPELLTVKAARLLGQADAVLYDDLSAGDLLGLARPDADLVSVGKRAGRPSPKQDHVSRLLVDYAKTGQHVVRLKSGDSGVFGRLEEEILALADLPSIEVLRSKILGVINAPPQKLVTLLNTPASQLARVIKAKSEQAA